MQIISTSDGDALYGLMALMKLLVFISACDVLHLALSCRCMLRAGMATAAGTTAPSCTYYCMHLCGQQCCMYVAGMQFRNDDIYNWRSAAALMHGCLHVTAGILS